MSTRGPRRRLAGHTLAFEGAPHDDQGKRIGWSGVAGYGRAKCSCGEMSEELPSGAQRRIWHVDHKNDQRVADYLANPRADHDRLAADDAARAAGGAA